MDTSLRGVAGMSDLMHAARAEAARVMEVTGGDVVAEHELLLDRLVEAEVVRREEVRPLLEIYRRTVDAGEGRCDPARAYFETRRMVDRLVSDQRVSPVAVTVATTALGTFNVQSDEDGATTVTVYRMSYASNLAAIGAGIGAILGGGAGGVLGGQIGGFVGGIIDEKKDDKGKGKPKT